jgi:hypothetical protein
VSFERLRIGPPYLARSRRAHQERQASAKDVEVHQQNFPNPPQRERLPVAWRIEISQDGGIDKHELADFV